MICIIKIFTTLRKTKMSIIQRNENLNKFTKVNLLMFLKSKDLILKSLLINRE